MTNNLNICQAVEAYLKLSFQPVPVCPKVKNPIIKDWTNRIFSSDDFPEKYNIGLKTGKYPIHGDSYLVCVDLDFQESIDLAKTLLPKTQAIEGRKSKPASHYWYLVFDIPAEWTNLKHGGPKGINFKKYCALSQKDREFFALKGSGQQTVVPPSFKDDEQRFWEDNECTPARISYKELYYSMIRLAEAGGARRVTMPNGSDAAKPKKKESNSPRALTAAKPKNKYFLVETKRYDNSIDDFNWNGYSWTKILSYDAEPWALVSGNGGVGSQFRRADKTEGVSAQIYQNEDGLEVFHNFSNSTRLNAGRYSKSFLFSAVKKIPDQKLNALLLAKMGFGKLIQPTIPSLVEKLLDKIKTPGNLTKGRFANHIAYFFNEDELAIGLHLDWRDKVIEYAMSHNLIEEVAVRLGARGPKTKILVEKAKANCLAKS